MNVLLLAGYRPNSRQPIGLETDEQGTYWIDSQILRLQKLGLSPIVVLAGEGADRVIQLSRCLEQCELVYDANGASANLLSNVKSGLRATEDACFVLPVEIPVPTESLWRHLKAELVREGFLTRYHCFQIGAEGAPWQYGFPLLISAFGRKVLLDLESPRGLADPRLTYHFSRLALALEALPL